MRSTNVQRIIDKLIDSVPNGIFEERTLEYCELSQFSKLLTSQELADFIYAHDPKVLQKKDVHPHPHKVKLQDAKDAVESGAVLGNNGIWQAFMCRNNPNKLKPPPATKSEAASVNETEEIPHIQVLELGRNEARVVPSQLLEDSQWRELTTRLFGVENLVGDVCFNNEMKGRADLLAGKLRDRLKSFLRRRVAPRISHVRPNLQFVSDTECILSNDWNKFTPCGQFPLRSGGYLYYDPDAMRWIRSGKV
ncbi:hypothetical protein ACHAXN_006183, partial [Cyclotella atomus]